ncbi:unnamed protein product [Cylindrotheca closterium]|uniref:Uncharacterized protein n=1 Tax=Cylindrotheca closterium TaxID=2856 RepID=A0AAD2GA26_9STRA|nr:unnamed protein product [Cylindrotheca closterium]
MEWPTDRTSGTAMAVWRHAAEAALVDITQDREKITPAIENFKQSLAACENFRTEYRNIIEEFVTIMASASNEQALDMAQAGIDALHSLMIYRLDSHTAVPAKDAFVVTSSYEKLRTVHIQGTQEIDSSDFQLPLVNPANIKEELYGHGACAQVDAWQQYGVLETSASVYAKTALVSRSLPSVAHRKKFCLLGCTSELGPARSLLLIPGAEVLGVCRGGEKYTSLLQYVEARSPVTTRLTVPENGADILTQGPEIAQWILDQTKSEDTLVLMPLAYADGEMNVRLCVAMDLIMQRITRQRRKAIVYQYSTPTQVLVLPPMAASAAQNRLGKRPTWEKFTSSLSLGNWLQPSLPESNNDYCILNGIATAQGPNYILAKTLQMWRCMIAYYRDDLCVSAPFAPICRTRSVVAYKSIAIVLEGMHHFEPMLAFDASVASSLMCAIMMSQIQVVNRPVPDMDENPFTLFWDGSAHGGVWTCPYTLESISTVNWMLGRTMYPKGYIPEAALAKEKTPEEKTKRTMAAIKALEEMEQSQFGKPMPECVRERLEFM